MRFLQNIADSQVTNANAIFFYQKMYSLFLV